MTGKDLLRMAGLGGLALFGLGLWLSGPLMGEVRIAAAFAARQTCACHFIGGRTIDACKADLPGATDGVQFTVVDQSVRVSVLGGVFGARAAYEEGYGCILD